MNSSYRIELNSLQEILKKRNLEERGKLQRFVASEVVRLSDKRVPMVTGTFKRQVKVEDGGKKVVYPGPQARYLYYGKVMVGPAPKRVTDKALTYNGAPMRGAMWFERTKTDEGEQIISSAAEMAGGRKGK